MIISADRWFLSVHNLNVEELDTCRQCRALSDIKQAVTLLSTKPHTYTVHNIPVDVTTKSAK